MVLEEVIGYFSLIHSSSGRLRVRVSSQILKVKDKINVDEVNDAILAIDGIKEVKFNKIMGSITILYDENKISEQFWLDLLNGKGLNEAKRLMEGKK